MTTEKLTTEELTAYEPDQRRVALDHLRLARASLERVEDPGILDHIIRIMFAGLVDMFEEYLDELEADE